MGEAFERIYIVKAQMLRPGHVSQILGTSSETRPGDGLTGGCPAVGMNNQRPESPASLENNAFGELISRTTEARFLFLKVNLATKRFTSVAQRP